MDKNDGAMVEEYTENKTGDRIIKIRITKVMINKYQNWEMAVWFWVSKVFWKSILMKHEQEESHDK